MKSVPVQSAPAPVPSPPSRGAWIEMLRLAVGKLFVSSPPSRGAWIEIFLIGFGAMMFAVAPLAGGVD